MGSTEATIISCLVTCKRNIITKKTPMLLSGLTGPLQLQGSTIKSFPQIAGIQNKF
jgi:hypothetical protein